MLGCIAHTARVTTLTRRATLVVLAGSVVCGSTATALSKLAPDASALTAGAMRLVVGGLTLAAVAAEGHRAVVVVPIAFTGEHIETLQEIDILYKEHAEKAGIAYFARARTVGCHPAFIGTLADLAQEAARTAALS